MAPTPALLEPRVAEIGPPPAPPWRGGGRGGWQPPRPDASQIAVLGMWVALAPILMLFLAFVSAYVVRHGLGGDWSSAPVPRLLWLNTGVLLASSFLLERGRAALRAGSRGRAWFTATLAAGLLFVLGQILGWRAWWSQGIRIDSTPHSSFFYLLTGAHAVHLSAGLLGLGAAALWPARAPGGLTRGVVARVTAIYWHFLGALWLGIFLVLNFWR
jgi:cytochrome c oxidase subunit 3